MERIEVNCMLGTKRTVNLTAQEMADIPVYLGPTYQQLRAAEYPPMAMYLDGVVKSDPVQIQAYIDACLAVKAKHPKV